MSYYRVIVTDAGVVSTHDYIWGFHRPLNPETKHALYDHMLQLHRGLPAPLSTSCSILPPTMERKFNGSRRYCRTLEVFKPDRSYMCRSTNRLVKRMDHHCIFVYSSIGWNNHKFFILFLFWLIVMGQFMAWKIAYAMSFITGLYGFHIMFNLLVACISGASSLALLTFLLFHIYLISVSMTTVEFGERYGAIDPCTGSYKSSPYNVDILTNFQQVFGHGSILSWFLPTLPIRASYEDGSMWLTNATTPAMSNM